MILYDTGYLGICFIFRLSGSVFPKAVIWAVPMGVVAVIIHMLFHDYPQADGVDKLWSGYTFVLGFLIVFRNNHAYQRFWEGATLINQTRGEWMNAISSLFAFCSSKDSKQDDVLKFQHLLVRLMSMLYCQALQQVCDLNDDSLEIIDVSGLDEESLSFLSGANDRCEVILQWIQRAIVEANATQVIDIAPPILSRAFQELSRGIVNLNNVRKIKDIPFPFPYAQMIQVMLMVHTFVTPFMASYYVVNIYWAGAVTFLVVCAMWSLVYIAREIDHPFGEDPNDFNVAEMQQVMNTSLLTLLQPKAQRPPGFELCDLALVRSDKHIKTREECAAVRPSILYQNSSEFKAKVYNERMRREQEGLAASAQAVVVQFAREKEMAAIEAKLACEREAEEVKLKDTKDSSSTTAGTSEVRTPESAVPDVVAPQQPQPSSARGPGPDRGQHKQDLSPHRTSQGGSPVGDDPRDRLAMQAMQLKAATSLAEQRLESLEEHASHLGARPIAAAFAESDLQNPHVNVYGRNDSADSSELEAFTPGGVKAPSGSWMASAAGPPSIAERVRRSDRRDDRRDPREDHSQHAFGPRSYARLPYEQSPGSDVRHGNLGFLHRQDLTPGLPNGGPTDRPFMGTV